MTSAARSRLRWLEILWPGHPDAGSEAFECTLSSPEGDAWRPTGPARLGPPLWAVTRALDAKPQPPGERIALRT